MTTYIEPTRSISAENEQFKAVESDGSKIVGASASIGIFQKPSGKKIASFERDTSQEVLGILNQFTVNHNDDAKNAQTQTAVDLNLQPIVVSLPQLIVTR